MFLKFISESLDICVKVRRSLLMCVKVVEGQDEKALNVIR